MWTKEKAENRMTSDMVPEARLSGDLEAAAARGDIGYLLEALKDASLEVRVAAVERLGELGGERTNLALLRVARDRWGERPEVRIAALRSLGRIHEPERYASILDEFITEENRKVIAAARKNLQAVDPQGFAKRLVARGAVDHGAIRIYGTSGESSAVPLIRGFLLARERAGDITSASNWGKAYAAVRALGNIGGREAVEILGSLLLSLETEKTRETGSLVRGRVEKIRNATRESLVRAEKG
jgi:HEAT repeat protein